MRNPMGDVKEVAGTRENLEFFHVKL